MIELKDFNIPKIDDKRLEKIINEIFQKEIFIPLLQSLEVPQNFLIHNSIDEIRNALIRGKIFYNRTINAFYSTKPYGTRLFAALQQLGGKLNKRTGNFIINLQLLPVSLQSTINKIDFNATLQKENLNKTLNQISKNNVPNQDFTEYFQNTGEKFSKSFQNEFSKKIHPIEPINKTITREMQLNISKDYSNSLNKYIKDFTNEEIQKIRILVQKQATLGSRSSVLKEILIKEYNISENKAKFLAKQEMSLFTASLQKAEFRQYGAKKFKWHTSQDERVRAEHKLLNGQIFSFDNLPIIDTRTGQRGIGGEAFGCRCTISPIFDFI